MRNIIKAKNDERLTKYFLKRLDISQDFYEKNERETQIMEGFPHTKNTFEILSPIFKYLAKRDLVPKKFLYKILSQTRIILLK